MKLKKNIIYFCALIIFSVNFSNLGQDCLPCSIREPAAHFCNARIHENLCVDGDGFIQGDLSVCGVINTGGLTACPAFGNVVRVDQVFGTANGARNGCPFKTINEALAVAIPGDVVWIFPGIYEESIVIPDGVAVRGLTANKVTIQRTNVTSDTDLVVMGEGSRVEDVLLRLTSNEHVNLRGIVFPGTTTLNSVFRYSSLVIDNSTAPSDGSSNVYGIHSTGTGRPNRVVSNVRSANIWVRSSGQGAKRGIIIDSPNGLFMRDTNINVEGGTDAIGAETNNLFAELRINTSTIGGTTADISQTNGFLSIATTDLINATANGYGFDTEIQPANFFWAVPGSLPAGISYMRLGSAPTSPYEISVPASQKLLIKSLNIVAYIPPGGSVTDTWIVRKNGMPTPLVVTLTGTQSSSINRNVSVHFDQGDDISLQIIRGNNSGTTDVIAIMEVY